MTESFVKFGMSDGIAPIKNPVKTNISTDADLYFPCTYWIYLNKNYKPNGDNGEKQAFGFFSFKEIGGHVIELLKNSIKESNIISVTFVDVMNVGDKKEIVSIKEATDVVISDMQIIVNNNTVDINYVFSFTEFNVNNRIIFKGESSSNGNLTGRFSVTD
jgi:hypothetical protein